MVGWTVTSIAVVALLSTVAWFCIGEPPEVERSRTVQLGMQQAQVEESMGGMPTTITTHMSTGEHVLYFGEPSKLFDLKCKVLSWLRRRTPSRLDNYRVRVHLDSKGRVDRIERGTEVEE